MKQRLISILMVLAMGLGLLTGCGKKPEEVEMQTSLSSDEGREVEITMVYPSDEGAEKKLNTLIEEFNKSYPNIKVNCVFVPFSNWPEYITKIKTMVAGNEGPDLCRLAVEGIQSFVVDGLALPFDEFIAENPELMEELGVNDINENINAPFIVDGKTYGFAWDWNNIMMYINKNILAEQNLDFPEETWTKDDYLKLAQAMTYEEDGQQIYGTTAPTDYFTVTAWLYNNNASVLNADMTECTLDSAQAIETIQFLYDLVYKYKVAPNPSSGMDTSNLFMNDQVGMWGSGRWMISTYANNNFEDYDIQALPVLETRQSSFGSGSFPVLSSSKHPYEAMLFSSWLSASEFSQETFLKTDSVPSRNSVMEKILPEMLPENGMAWRDAADNARSIQAPMQLTDISSVFDKYMSLIFADEISVEEGMKNATEEINKILAE